MTPDPENDALEPDDGLAAEPAAAAPAEDTETLRAKAAERDDYLDRLKRTMAEFQNYKNRVGKEKAELRKFVTGDVVRSILPVLDNLERAVLTGTEGPLLDGVRMVIDQFERALEQLGVKPIETVNARFDPTQMEAVARIETPDAEENTVLEVFEKGYRLDDLVIRPARVTVASPVKPDYS